MPRHAILGAARKVSGDGRDEGLGLDEGTRHPRGLRPKGAANRGRQSRYPALSEAHRGAIGSKGDGRVVLRF